MSRYIDAELAKETIRKWFNTNTKAKAPMPRICKQAMTVSINAVDLTPTADAVEVVYCRDCKHNQDNGGDCNRTITHTSRDLVCEVNEYKYIGLEYCSYGERREK